MHQQIRSIKRRASVIIASSFSIVLIKHFIYLEVVNKLTMKSIFLIFALALFIGVQTLELTEEQRGHIHAQVEDCIQESKVDRQLLDDMKNGKKVTVTRELNCFAKCIFERKGDMNKDGTLVIKPTDSEAAKKCKELKMDDPCDTAGEVMGCFAKNNLIPKMH